MKTKGEFENIAECLWIGAAGAGFLLLTGSVAFGVYSLIEWMLQ